MTASYISLAEKGVLQERVDRAWEGLRSCTLCPRRCNVNRLDDERGVCRTGRNAVISSFGPHFGEERVLVGRRGSGTIFFANCNLKCIYCQNYDISQFGQGEEAPPERLASIMLEIQGEGCHNLNLVTPSHVIPQILKALQIAIEKGLRLPVVYNSGGYDSVDSLRLLEGIVDIYMPDMKYSDPEVAARLSLAPDYPERNKEAVKEMHRQVGDLVVDDGIARRGLLVRHLVLPEGLAGTREVMRFLATEVSRNTYVNVMAQYYPAYHSFRHPPLGRRITDSEYRHALEVARSEGLTRFDRG